MEQRHLPESNEPVSDDEVRALIERFGERQAAPPGQPTVKDVAETLQIEPTTVASMLAEIRESKSQNEIKERLDRLEKESDELRKRTHNLPEHGSSRLGSRRKIATAFAVLAAVLIVLVIAKGGGGLAEGVILILPLIAIVTIFKLFLRYRNKR